MIETIQGGDEFERKVAARAMPGNAAALMPGAEYC
jgi:hypothetical protein